MTIVVMEAMKPNGSRNLSFACDEVSGAMGARGTGYSAGVGRYRSELFLISS